MDLRKVLQFSIGPVVSAVLGLITLPIVAWLYSVDDIGRLAMLQVASALLVLVFSAGLDQSYVREYHEDDNKSALLLSVLLPSAGFMIIAFFGFFLFPRSLSSLIFGVDSVVLTVFVLVCFISVYVSRFLSLILRMQERGIAFSVSLALPKLVFLAIIGAYFFTSSHGEIIYLIFAHAVSLMSVMFWYIWMTRRDWGAALRSDVDLGRIIGGLRFGLPLAIGGAAFWGLTAMDKVLLRTLSTFSEVGVYSVSVSFAGAALVIQSIFSTVWAPTVYKWASEGVPVERMDAVSEYMLVIVVVVFCIVGSCSWTVGYLLPAEYEDVPYILVTCMAYPLFYTLSEATSVGLGIARKTRYSALVSVVALTVNLIGNLVLIPELGAKGAAISTALSFWFFLVLRTELACLVWRQFERKSIYVLSGLCLGVSIFSLLAGDEGGTIPVFLWLLILALTLYLYRKRILCLFPIH